MKINLYLIVLLLFFGIDPSKIAAQDIQFSQFYAASLYLNPAFSGSAHSTRGMFHQRLQWPALDAKYITSMASIDTYFSKYKSGVSLIVMQDYQGSNIIKSSDINLQYSYLLPLTEKYTLRSGLQLGYVSRYINYSSLIYPDQYNDQGYTGPSEDNVFGNQRISYMDVAAGGILHSDKIWVGFAAHHLNRPNQSFLGEVSRLPAKFSFVAGYKFKMRGWSDDYSRDYKEASIIPTVHYKFQGMSDQLDLGVYALYNQVIFGFWYRGLPVVKRYQKGLQNNESFILLGGYKLKSISMSYSYDFTVSRLATARTGGSHELNVTYVYKKSTKRKPMRRLPCPKFHPH